MLEQWRRPMYPTGGTQVPAVTSQVQVSEIAVFTPHVT
jgi:hypothetical protein